MRIAIIGAGIAGLATAKRLLDNGHEVIVLERNAAFREIGLGFILLPNGIEAMQQMGAWEQAIAHGLALDKVYLQNSAAMPIVSASMQDAVAIKRSRCIDALRYLLPENIIKTNFCFSHFTYNLHGEALAVHSTNGELMEADIFIAADGANSPVRASLFPTHTVRSSRIHELVGICDAETINKQLAGSLLKTQEEALALTFGLLPCNATQVIWYMQYDSSRYVLENTDDATKKAFALQHVGHWPAPIKGIIELTDFAKVFLWQTKDMELLPCFHQQNIVLAGDAAHLALPFTSQGTNSALNDALFLGNHLSPSCTKADLPAILNSYYDSRKTSLQTYLQFGRTLEDRFLYPEKHKDSNTPIPFAK